MYRDTTYKEKFAILKAWVPEILEVVKKDLRNEHLKQDFMFVKKYFPGKSLNKITLEDMVEGYQTAIASEENGEKIAEFISNRWMLQKTDVYGFFETELTKIDPNFSDIQEIPSNAAKPLIGRSIDEFGALDTYLFAVLNSVAFSKGEFEALEKLATAEEKARIEETERLNESESFDALKAEFEQKLIRLEDKYEKKLSGMQKKYVTETEMLKKQIANLQRKLPR